MPFDPKSQGHLTDASNVSRDQSARSEPGMAHFAGTGPAGERCGGCEHWKSIPKRSSMHCAKYRQMTGGKGTFLAIHSSTWACKHWRKR